MGIVTLQHDSELGRWPQRLWSPPELAPWVEQQRDHLIILVAGRDEVVRAPPFDAVEIPVAEIFGDDEAGEEAEQG